MEYRDNNITGVNFDEEAVQQNWQGKGGFGFLGVLGQLRI
jgi:hypothetical protein